MKHLFLILTALFISLFAQAQINMLVLKELPMEQKVKDYIMTHDIVSYSIDIISDVDNLSLTINNYGIITKLDEYGKIEMAVGIQILEIKYLDERTLMYSTDIGSMPHATATTLSAIGKEVYSELKASIVHAKSTGNGIDNGNQNVFLAIEFIEDYYRQKNK